MSTATDTGFVDSGELGPLHYAGVLLAVVTGLIHLRLGVGFAPSPLGLSFLFAGVVFLAAGAAVVANYRRGLLYRLGIPFTAGQIVLWYYVNFAAGTKAFPADVGTLGAVDKVAQVVLLVVLALLLRE
ncbi:hypothetical protein EI982_15750 [Haloplanus rallus]|jgi:hypothetical protein|uniref:Uncharacterized protein n=1 Tax=Haloplanus rallus TaxID=1816183 RepID=A0A6B9F6U8_9EURY|nr:MULTISPECIES: hypothetical protein [Haloplanus]QGX96128.1 hypothetical protein EI982_15750 [Haloplanus rallus]